MSLEKYPISIGELSKILDLPSHTIRYWHQMFHHIDHQTNDGGRRYYNATSVEQFQDIKDLLYVKKFTISGAQEFLYSKKQIDNKKDEELPNLFSNTLFSNPDQESFNKKVNLDLNLVDYEKENKMLKNALKEILRILQD